jgi:tripartite-type tricarboxylate transporter receptor subunit TctC
MRIASLVMALLLGVAAPVAASAQAPADYPNHPVRIVVPYPPGGVNDAVARVVAQKLQENTGKTFIVDNKAGGGTVIATQYVANAAADGYTLLVMNPTSTINVSSYKSLPYDIVKDFKPISLLVSYPTLIVVGAAQKAHTLQELIAEAKAQPGKVVYASGGTGGFTHLAAELFKKLTDTDMYHVPYKGSASTVPPLLTGEVAVTFGDFLTYLPLMREGQLRGLAVAGSRRFPATPDIPTTTEAGVPGYDADVWLGLAAPMGTPDPIVDRLNREIRKVLGASDVAERLRNQGVEPIADTPQEFAQLIKTDVQKWAQVVKFAGITPE